MRITIDRETFLDAYASISGVIPSRTPKPVLMNAKLVAALDGEPELMANDLELGVRRGVLGIRVEAPGAALLPPRFAQILKSCSGDAELAVEADGGGLLHVRGARSRFTLPSEDPGLFPDPPAAPEPGTPSWRIDPDELRMAVRRTAYATDPDSTRYALAGVLLEPDADDPTTLRLVATDGRRLAAQEVAAERDGGDGDGGPMPSAVVPVRALNLAAKAAGDGPVTVSPSANAVLIRSGRTATWARLVEGRFPSWRAVLPGSHSFAAEFAEAGALLSAVEQARVATSKESRAIDCEFTDGDMLGPVLKLSSRSADVGESAVELPVGGGAGSSPLAISFDGQYLAELLRSLDPGTPLRLEATDHKSAAVFRTPDGLEAVIMPLNRDR